MRAELLDKVIYGISRSITLTPDHPTHFYYKKGRMDKSALYTFIRLSGSSHEAKSKFAKLP